MNISASVNEVDWDTYAQQYDLLLTYNPYYQDLFVQVKRLLKDWPVEKEKDATIVDLGAGTGNYSVAAARIFPQVRILHVDNNSGMNAVASRKATGLDNFQILDLGIEELHFAPNSLSGIICINAIYTFPDPQGQLKKMYDWLAPDACAILVDPGRVMNRLSWKITLAMHLLKTYGWRKTLEIFRKAKAVSEQNAYIRKMQKSGVFWTHTHREFCEAVREAGFGIEASSICFKGYCDLVVARK